MTHYPKCKIHIQIYFIFFLKKKGCKVHMNLDTKMYPSSLLPESNSSNYLSGHKRYGNHPVEKKKLENFLHRISVHQKKKEWKRGGNRDGFTLTRGGHHWRQLGRLIPSTQCFHLHKQGQCSFQPASIIKFLSTATFADNFFLHYLHEHANFNFNRPHK